MAKKKSKKHEHPAQKNAPAVEAPKPKPRQVGALRKRRGPNWPVLMLALLGVLLTAYLSYNAVTRSEALFCGEGSGCDVVQESRWATLLGMPIATWGLLAYLSMAWIAYRVRDPQWHWKLLFMLSLVGVGVSVYLTSVSVFVIGATCTYCLVSLGLITAILLVCFWQKPAGLPGFSWPLWLAQTAGLTVLVVALLGLYHGGWLVPGAGPEDPYLKALAIHLTKSDAKMYGASWCPVCQQQKAMFKASARRLPYVECSPGGPGAPRAPECVQQNVSSYPTWVINGEHRVGLLQVDELARMTNFSGVTQTSGG